MMSTRRERIRRLAPMTIVVVAVFLVAPACHQESSVPQAAVGRADYAPVKVASDGTEHVTLVIKTDVEHGALGLDGVWHDAFLPASFTAKVGVPVTVKVLNYDGGWHSFTAPSIGLDVILKAGKPNYPGVTTFTFTPKKSGEIPWFCKAPCDPWAMARIGYMQGSVQVVA
jgi:heme/copper-type cytochrome/quinol oxidase subunit 2